jgi:hypothetical protein
VIAGFAIHHVHYPVAYSGGEPIAPDCWADAPVAAYGMPDPSEDALVPDPRVPHRYAPSCSDCPKNQWGTALGGRASKACPMRMRVALLVLGGEKSGAIQDPRQAVPAILDLSSTAVRPFRKYLARLQDAGAPYFTVISRVGFDQSKSWPLPSWEPIEPVEMRFKPRVRALVEAAPRLVTQSPWPLANEATTPATAITSSDDPL